MIDKQQAIQKGIKILDNTENSNSLFAMLQTRFPETIKEGQASLKAIAALLGKDLSNMQGYELTFTGKGLANALYTTPCQKVLKHKETFCHSKSQNEVSLKNVESLSDSKILDEKCGLQEEAQGSLVSLNDRSASSLLPHLSLKDESQTNTLIIGDNLDALKVLKSAYSEKIKMIYIDPPYNTGGDNFIYPDDFREDYKAILREVGLLERDENNNEVESETLQFFRNITGSKSHSGWLSFMLPRLKLARDLLREDGVIFISIDDNEQANLKILCDEIFGEENFVACLCIVDNLKGNNNTDGISQTNEYCLTYAKNSEILKIGELKIQEDDENLQKWNIDDLGYWKEGRNIKGTGENAPREKRPSMFYPIYLNDNMEISLEKNDDFYIEVLPLTNGKEMCWNWGKDFLRNNKHELIVKKTDNGFNFIKKQRPILGDLPSKKIKTTCYSPKYSTSVSSNTIKEIFNNENVFNYSKSVYLIKDLLQISTSANSNDIILDFFAGSGTTAQAVMELNSEDGGNRQFILVQIDEPINEDKSKVAYDFCKNELKSANPTISNITIERVKRAAKKINANTCFNVFTLENKPKLISDETSLKLEINADLSALDKAINLALSAGKTLSQTLQVVIEGKLYKCEDSYFCIECDKEVLEALAKTSDEYIYLDGFADINLEHFLNLDAQFKERLNVVY